MYYQKPVPQTEINTMQFSVIDDDEVAMEPLDSPEVEEGSDTERDEAEESESEEENNEELNVEEKAEEKDELDDENIVKTHSGRTIHAVK